MNASLTFALVEQRRRNLRVTSFRNEPDPKWWWRSMWTTATFVVSLESKESTNIGDFKVNDVNTSHSAMHTHQAVLSENDNSMFARYFQH